MDEDGEGLAPRLVELVGVNQPLGDSPPAALLVGPEPVVLLGVPNCGEAFGPAPIEEEEVAPSISPSPGKNAALLTGSV
jgi:hypothetical protein